jgi:hypothetical protein
VKSEDDSRLIGARFQETALLSRRYHRRFARWQTTTKHTEILSILAPPPRRSWPDELQPKLVTEFSEFPTACVCKLGGLLLVAGSVAVAGVPGVRDKRSTGCSVPDAGRGRLSKPRRRFVWPTIRGTGCRRPRRPTGEWRERRWNPATWATPRPRCSTRIKLIKTILVCCLTNRPVAGIHCFVRRGCGAGHRLVTPGRALHAFGAFWRLLSTAPCLSLSGMPPP